MSPKLESIAESMRGLLSTAELTQHEAQLLANWLLQTGAKIKGYNNYENDHVSGENFFRKSILSCLRPSLCVDVGANIGAYSEGLLNTLTADVIAFEPLHAPYGQLELLKAKYPDRFIPENLAVGAQQGHGTINFNPEVTEHASMTTTSENVAYLNNSFTQEIEVVSLDKYFATGRTPDFIKIDVEGLEYEVLLGARNLVLNSPPACIQIEMNWHQLFRRHSLWSLSQELEAYEVFQLLPNCISRKDPKDPLANLFMFSNFIFVRADLIHLIPETLIVPIC